MGNKFRLVIFFFFLLGIAIYFITSGGKTAFNHFTLLADSFIHGKTYIEGQMPWLEKIPIDENRFYVANPPMPALMSMLPVLVFGKNFPQEYLAHLIGALIIVITMLISIKIKDNLKLAIWSGILVGFGTINWFLSSVGSTWYLAQITAELFLSLAIFSVFSQKKPLITGLLLGFSYFSRIPTILSLPFFLFVYRKEFLKNAFLLFIGLIPSLLLNFLYNYARFGVIWDIGYTLIPGVSTEPWYQMGVIHPSYIINHIKIVFGALPVFIKSFPYILPSLSGLAIWITTPAFIYSFFAKFKDKFVLFSWISIIAISLLIFSHGSTGFTQFGYRFAVDFYPFLTYLTIKGVSNSGGPKWHHWILLFIGVIINLWGILSINIFKWV